MTTRRELLLAIGACTLTAPLASFAQQQRKVWRVGFLGVRRPVSLDSDVYGAFAVGMHELGYIEGKNLSIEWRFGDGKDERLGALAMEFVRLKVDAIVTPSASGAKAAQNATRTIPIVMVNTTDPVRDGLVASLARPGGNITGLSSVLGELSAKHVEMLLSIVPKLSSVAVLINPGSAAHPSTVKSVQARAREAGVKVVPVEAMDIQGLENAFATMTRSKVGAVIVLSHGFFNQQRQRIAELAVRNRLPSITVIREYAEAGGLMSYGPNYADNYRRAAIYVDKIFKGAKPADLPVEQPTKFELFINRKTAKALGLTIPQSLLISADKVIE